MTISKTVLKVLMAFLSVCIALVVGDFAVGFLVPIRDVGPSFSQHHPVLGQHLRPNFSTVRKTPEFTMKLSTNSLGFRGTQTGALPKGAILFLGDSFTMGYGVDDGGEYPAIVAARLSQQPQAGAIPVVNAGIGGSGNGRWVKLLESVGEAMQPRLVVMQVLDNDFDDNIGEGLFALDVDGGLKELPVPPPGLGRTVQSFIEAVPGLPSSNLVGLLRQVRLNSPQGHTVSSAHPEPGELLPNDRLTVLILEKAILLCREKGWPMLGLNVGLEGARRAAVRDLFVQHGVVMADLPGKQQRPDLYYKFDGHWNAAGHVAAADRVLEELGRVGIGER